MLKIKKLRKRVSFVGRGIFLLALVSQGILFTNLPLSKADLAYAADPIDLRNGSKAEVISSDISTYGNNGSHAIQAFDGSEVKVAGSTLHTSGDHSYGLKLEKSYLKISDGSTSETSGKYAHSVMLDASSADISDSTLKTGGYASHAIATLGATVLSADHLSASTSGVSSHAVYLSKTSFAKMTNSELLATGDKSYGFYAPEASADISGSRVTTLGKSGYGIYASSSALAFRNGSIVTSGDAAHGVLSNNKSNVSLSSAAIETRGKQSAGVYALSNSSADITDGSKLTIIGDVSYGVLSMSGSKAKISGSAIETRGKQSTGVYVYSNSSADITDGSEITTLGSSSNGVLAGVNSSVKMSGAKIKTDADVSHAVVIASDSRAEISGGTEIITSKDSSFGVGVTTKSKATIDNASIKTQGRQSHAVYVAVASSADITNSLISTNGDAASAVYISGLSSVTVESSDINVSGTSAFFHVENGGTINLKRVVPAGKNGNDLLLTSSHGNLNVSESVLAGNIVQSSDLSSADATMAVSLKDNSSWSGAANVVNRNMAGVKVDLSVDGSSVWNVTGDSYTNGALVNNGAVNFGSSKEEGFKEVNVNSYSADGGVLVMKTDLKDKEGSDLLFVKDSATGKSELHVYNTAPSGAERSNALVKVMGDSANAEFVLRNPDIVINNVAYSSAGAWKYRLENGSLYPGSTGPVDANREWYLLRDGTTPTGDAITKAAVQHDLWYTETNTMTKRLGIYRDNLWNGGLWFEAAANKENFKTDETNMLNENQNFKTGTIGYDFKKESANGIWWYGLMAGYGKNTSDLIGGVGELDIKSYHASLYAVYRDNGGMYINTILKYNKYKNDMRINHKDSFTQSLQGYDGGEWDQNGLGISLQAGKKYEIADSDGWYWEPQLQFSWNRVFASDYTTKSGITVNIDDIDYIRLRGGVVIGKQITFADGRLLDLYGDLSVIHDFDGDAVLRMSGAEHKSSLGGTWATIGLGANYRYAQGKFMHLRFQYSDGTSYREPFTVYAGLSFETN